MNAVSHAVAQVVRCLPLRDVFLRYRWSWTARRWSVVSWSVVSRTRIVRRRRDMPTRIEAARALAVAAAAGPEAEARWLAQQTGMPLDAAREHVMAESGNRDVRRAACFARRSDLTPDELALRVRALVDRHWDLITGLADQLVLHGYLTGSAVRDFVHHAACPEAEHADYDR